MYYLLIAGIDLTTNQYHRSN